jgi:hypothetical protein
MQMGMIAASLFIVFTVIMPKLEDIKIVEDETQEYKKAVENAAAYNNQLAGLSSQKNSFTKNQLESIERYLPDKVDEIAVMADLQSMSERAGLTTVGIGVVENEEGDTTMETDSFTYDENGEPIAVEREPITHKDFQLTTEGTYSAIKSLLGYLEFNDYQLEVVDMQFTPKQKEGEETVVVNSNPDFIYNLTLRTYSFNNQ